MVSTISITFKTTIMTTKSSEQQSNIDNTEKALDLLKKWYEEDKDNRGFIFLTSERLMKVDDEYAYGGTFSLLGRYDILKAGLVKCICDPDNPLAKIYRRALEHILLLKLKNKFNS